MPFEGFLPKSEGDLGDTGFRGWDGAMRKSYVGDTWTLHKLFTRELQYDDDDIPRSRTSRTRFFFLNFLKDFFDVFFLLLSFLRTSFMGFFSRL